MDGQRFDSFTRLFALQQSRRGLVGKALAGIGLAGAGFGLGASTVRAGICLGNGQSCANDTPCCEGFFCVDQSCTDACGSDDGFTPDQCREQSDCCEGWTCTFGLCTRPCAATGEKCGGLVSCCGIGLCDPDNGTCFDSCVGPGEACGQQHGDLTVDCCGNNVCTDGFCPLVCAEIDDECSVDSECCDDLLCDFDGHCCAGANGACVDDGDCCGDRTCVGSICVSDAECAAEDASCLTDDDCCEDLTCIGAPQTGWNYEQGESGHCGQVSCAAEGADCSADEDCCSPNTCAEGSCTAPPTDGGEEEPVDEPDPVVLPNTGSGSSSGHHLPAMGVLAGAAAIAARLLRRSDQTL